MNYCAHAFLSPDDPFIVSGNLVTDMLKGNVRQTIDRRFTVGIQLHREIDIFTDQHASVIAMKKKMLLRFGRYTPVASDIFMDYLLYKNWNRYTDTPFQTFKTDVYQRLRSVVDLLPQEVSHRLGNMIDHDWLQVYTSREGINEVFDRMFFRLTKPEILSKGGDWLLDHVDLLESDFFIFFDAIRLHLKNQFSFY